MMKYFCNIFVFSFLITGILTKCDSNQCYQEMHATSITVYSMTSGTEGVQFDDHSFVHAYLLKELLFQIEFDEQTSRKEFVQFFKEITEVNENKDRTDLNKFYHEYNKHSSIWWYTYPGFIHNVLNDVLRTQDVLNLLRMNFFIQKLNRQLEHMSKNADEVTNAFLVYHGQGLTYDDYDKLKKIEAGGLLAFNTFLSANTNYEEAVNSAHRAVRDGSETAILFSIIISSSNSVSIPFACIDDLNYFENSENEYMFSINTIFQIEQLEKLPGQSSILHVKLRPISIHDIYVRSLMQTTRKQIEGSTPMFQLAKLTTLMKKYSTAEIIYNHLLNETVPTEVSDRELIYFRLSMIREQMNDFEGALDLSERVWEIANSHRETNDSLFPVILIRMASLLQKLKRFDVAIDKLQEALRLELQASVPDFRQRAKLYNDIGVVLGEQGKYNESVEYKQQSLSIDLEYNSDDYVNIGITYENMASTYRKIKNYDMAVSCFEKAIDYHLQTNPIQTMKIIQDSIFIAEIFKELGRQNEAVEYARTAAKYLKQILSSMDSRERILLDRLESILNTDE